MVVERGEKRKEGTRRGWKGREEVHGLKILIISAIFMFLGLSTPLETI